MRQVKSELIFYYMMNSLSKSVSAEHHMDYSPSKLKEIYNKADLKVLRVRITSLSLYQYYEKKNLEIDRYSECYSQKNEAVIM